jgi:hypothetical protein
MAAITSHRGRLVAPTLDDRSWDDLVRQARELIPRYAPGWTDHNPSDIGITLIELFAFLVEGLTYRLNQVPERNYVAFLNLLGITRDPATPARVYLTFTAQPNRTVEVPAGQQAQTAGTETEPPIVFETERPVTVLPIDLATALLVDPAAGEYRDLSARFTSSPAIGGTIPVPAGGRVLLALGFGGRTGEALDIEWQLSSPLARRSDAAEGDPRVVVTWRYSTDANPPAAWTTAPAEGRGSTLEHDGVARLRLPVTGADAWTAQKAAAWGLRPAADTGEVGDERFWIGVDLQNGTAQAVSLGIDRILFNAAPAHAALTVPAPEDLGLSDGTDFQVFALSNRPVFRAPGVEDPYFHVRVRVADEPWTRVDELPAGDARVYRLDPVTGEIGFGDFDPARRKGRGLVPPAGARVTATYRYVAAGLRSNVGAGRVAALRTPVSGILGVANLAASFGASDEEPIEQTMRRAPEVLKNRDRAVTREDYEYLAREASTDVAIVRCLPPRRHERAHADPAVWKKDDPWNFAGLYRGPGHVHVVIVPDVPPARVLEVPRPEPSRDLLDEVQRYLDERRDLTARLQVVGPRYLPIVVTVKVMVFRSAIERLGLVRDEGEVVRDIGDRLRRLLHPVRGGPAGAGWLVGQNVFMPDVFRAAMPPESIGFISDLKLAAATRPPYHDPPIGPGGEFKDDRHRPFLLSRPGTWVQLADYELVCFGEAQVDASVTDQ